MSNIINVEHDDFMRKNTVEISLRCFCQPAYGRNMS